MQPRSSSQRPGGASEWAARGAAAVDRGDLAAARKCFLAAVQADSRNAQRRFELAVVVEALGETDHAAEQLTKALRLDPKMTSASRRLCQLLDRGTLPDSARLDSAGLRAALAHDTADRDLLSAAILHHLSRTYPMRDALQTGRVRGWTEAARILCLRRTGELLRNEVLIEVLRRGVVSNPDAERLFTALRRVLLLETPPSRFDDPALVQFAVALMRQCWINEFVWYEEAEESSLLGDRPVDAGKLLEGDLECGRAFLLRSMYRPPEQTLDPGMEPGTLGNIRPQALREAVAARLSEAQDIRARASRIPRLGTISNETSRRVADQYEASPYPRWTSVLTLRTGEYLKKLGRIFKAEELRALDGPFEVLIAGCGTGRQAVSAAFDYGPNARVTAIDISASSLGYASRMADRMGAKNITFLRGDLRDIGSFSPPFTGRFQVIECVGVLHHMQDPFGAWQSLKRCLAPGGLMLIGLYSAIARRHLTDLKTAPDYPGAGCSDEALRNYRRHLVELPDGAPGSEFRSGLDFYSASGFRDFFLHVSERCYTLPDIARFLAENGLEFRGFFDIPFQRLQRSYPSEVWPGSLDRWAAVELEHPRLFGSMYQFWCTAKAGSAA
jgi:SAM-dependent methyltransferase